MHEKILLSHLLSKKLKVNTYVVCVFQCQPTVLLRTSGSVQGRQMALNVVYFRFTHCLARSHYMWDEYLYTVLEEVEVRVTVCVSVCVM